MLIEILIATVTIVLFVDMLENRRVRRAVDRWIAARIPGCVGTLRVSWLRSLVTRCCYEITFTPMGRRDGIPWGMGRVRPRRWFLPIWWLRGSQRRPDNPQI